jgi:hypothetical protein
MCIFLSGMIGMFANSIINVFSAVFLYKQGLPIHLILLVYFFQFFIVGFFALFAPEIVKKIGLGNSVLVSRMTKFISILVLVGLKDLGIIHITIIILSLGISGAINNPIWQAILSHYINDNVRGEVNSINSILKSITSIIVVVLTGIVISAGSENLLVIIALITSIIAVIPIYILDDKSIVIKTVDLKHLYANLKSNEFKKNIIPVSLHSLIMIESFLIGLYIFITVGKITTVANIMAIAMGVEFIVISVFGIEIDREGLESLKYSAGIKSITSILFLISSSIGSLYIFKTMNGIARKMHTTSFATLVQKRAKSSGDEIMFSALKEMILCVVEAFVFLILAIISYFIGEKIFNVIFISTAVAVALTYVSWKKTENAQNESKLVERVEF